MNPRNDAAPECANTAEAGNQATRTQIFNTAGAPVKALPMTGSIKRQILDALRAGQKLTSLDAWLRFGTSRLAALVFQLRAAGWTIDSEDIVVETAHGHKAHISQYSMTTEARHAGAAR